MSARVKRLGCVDYVRTWQAMRTFVQARMPAQDDEIWLLEHPPVFTQGLAGKREHILDAGDIPVVQTDRGGQVTYHGPGQLIAYVLLDLKRLGVGPRELVRRLESAILQTLQVYDLAGTRRAGAPGVYVEHAKVAALGLRLRNGYSYHGLSLNVALDLTPFARINPCGYQGLEVTSLARLGVKVGIPEVAATLVRALTQQLYGADAQTTQAADNDDWGHPSNGPPPNAPIAD